MVTPRQTGGNKPTTRRGASGGHAPANPPAPSTAVAQSPAAAAAGLPAPLTSPPIVTPPPAAAPAPAPPAAAPATQADDTVKINLDKMKKVLCHSFKLSVGKMIKNQEFYNNKWKPIEMEHCHFYHSITSQGRVTIHSSRIGGHMHEVKIQEQKDKTIKMISVGPAVADNGGRIGPVRLVRQKKNNDGDITTQARFDDHTHTLEYLNSEEINVSIKK